jgi:TP901 family phage tail tape measure protein
MAGEQATLGKMIVDLLLDDTAFNEALGGAQRSMQSGGASLTGMAKQVGDQITSAFKVATGAITAFGAASAVVGANFEQQMAMVGALQGLQQTDQAFQDLQGQARLLGSTTEFTATQAAEALQELARAGATVDESIQSSNSALTLAGTSAASLADSTQLLVATQRQFGLQAAESERITNVFSLAMRKSLLDFQSIREAMKFAGTAGASFGMTLEETTAAVAAFRDLGLEGSLAGTNFRMAMIAAAKGTDQQAAALEKYGLTLADINPETNKFADIIETLGEAGITASDAVAVFGSRAGANMAQLAAETARGNVNMRAFTSTLMQASDEGNTAADMYKTIGQTVAFATKISISALQDLMIEVFDTFAGPLRDLIQTLPEVLNTVTAAVRAQAPALKQSFGDTLAGIGQFLRENAEGLADAFVNTMKAIAALGPVLEHLASLLVVVARNADIVLGALAFGTAVVAAVKLVSVVSALSVALGGATSAVTVLGTTLTVTTGGMFAAVAAVGALVAGLGVLISNIATARSETEALNDAQAQLAGEQEALAATLEQELLPVLAKQQAMARERLRTEEDLSDEEAQRLQRILALTAAEAAQLEAEGKLLRSGGQLVEVSALVAEHGDDAVRVIDSQAAAMDAATEASDTRIASLERLAESAAASNSEAFRSAELSRAAALLGRDEIATVQELTERIRAEKDARESTAARAAALRDQVATASRDAFKREAAAAFDAERAIAQAKGLGAQDQVDTTQKKVDKLLALEQRLAEDVLRAQGDEAALRRLALDRRIMDIKKAAAEGIALAGDDADAKEAIANRRNAAIAQANAVFRANEEKAAQALADREAEEARRAAEEAVKAKQQAMDLLAQLGVQTMTHEQRLAEQQAQVLAALQDESVGVQVAALERLGDAYRREVSEAAREAARSVLDFGKQVARTVDAGVQAVGNLVAAFSGFQFDLRDSVQDVLDLEQEQMDAQSEALAAIADAQERLAEAQAEGNEGAAERAAEDLAAAQQALKAAEDKLAGGTEGFAAEMVDTLIQNATNFATAFAEAAGPLMERVAEKIPVVMEAVIAAIPQVAAALAEHMPTVLQGIVDALPALLPVLVDGLTQVVVAVLEQLPSLLSSLLGDALPVLITQVVEALPPIIAALIQAIPEVIVAVVESLPAIVLALIDAIPTLFQAFIESLPMLIAGMIEALPRLLVAIVNGLVKELVLALPRLVKQMWQAIIDGAANALKGIAEGIWNAIKEFFNIFKKKNDKDDKKGGKSAFSGISYVPATMRMTVHQGEAVVDAARNAENLGGGPAAAGATQAGHVAPGGGGGGGPLDIAVFAEGRLIDAVQVLAMKRGSAVGMQREIRRASGVRIGLDRGRFSPWSG